MGVRWMAENFKNRMLLSAELASCLLLLFLRIPLSRTIGDAGTSLFCPAFEAFWLTTLVISGGMCRALAGIVRYRVKRERYRNARKALQTAFFLNLFLGAGFSLAVALCSSFVAGKLALEPLARMAVLAAAPAIFLAAFPGVFRGYLNGYGMGGLTAQSLYVERLSMVIFSFLGGRLFYGYGLKVAALKQVEGHAFAYGALGAMVGVCLSQIIAILHLLILFAVYGNVFFGRHGQDGSRRETGLFEVQRLLLGNLAPFSLIVLLSNLFMLADQRFFNYCMNVTGQGDGRTAQWGSYYGKLMALLGMGVAFSCLFAQSHLGKACAAHEREEHRAARERVGLMVRNASMAAFPTAIYMAVLAKPLALCCYGKAAGQAEILAGWLAKGAALVALSAFALLLGQILCKLHMLRELLLAVLLSFVAHVAAAWLLVRRAHMGAEGLLLSLFLSCSVYLICAFPLFRRRVKYRPDWLGEVAFPFVSAAVSGFVVWLLQLALSGIAEPALTILISLPVGLFFHILLLALLRVIGEAQLQEIPFGGIFVWIGRKIGML